MNWHQHLQQGISPQGLLDLPQGEPLFIQLDEHLVEYLATHNLEDIDQRTAARILQDACKLAYGLPDE